MKTKGMSKRATINEIELLKKRIDFNNRLNKEVRKFMKDKGKFNGYHDEPTLEMIDFLNSKLKEEMDWMPLNMRMAYIGDVSAIFGQVYSASVNTYLLKDLHDCEAHLKEIESAEQETTENNELFRVERDIENTRLNLYFDGKPEEEVRSALKHRGFKWSPYLQAWTRQLTRDAEVSLNLLKRDLGL